MYREIMFWSFLANAVLLILHEIDGAYWKEWKMFNEWTSRLSDKTGLTLYLAAHVPILTAVMLGFACLDSPAGRIVSLVLAGFMPAHCAIHLIVRKRCREEFGFPASFAIIYAAVPVSIIQFLSTVMLL